MSIEQQIYWIHEQDKMDVVMHHKRLLPLKRMGVYDEIAERYRKKAGIHLDVSSFVGSVLMPLIKQNSDLHIITSQRNPVAATKLEESLTLAEERFHGEIKHYRSIKQSFIPTQNGNVQRTFHLGHPELANMNFAAMRPSILVVNEEMDDMSVTGEILGDQKIDSASLHFPMENFARTREAPHPCGVPSKEEILSRLRGIVHGEMRGAYRFITERMHTGGELFLALDTTVSDLGIIIDDTRKKLMHRFADCWDAGKSDVLDVTSNGRTISLISFLRNQRPVPQE